MSHIWNHAVCSLLSLAFFHLARNFWDLPKSLRIGSWWLFTAELYSLCGCAMTYWPTHQLISWGTIFPSLWIIMSKLAMNIGVQICMRTCFLWLLGHMIICIYIYTRASLVAQLVKNPSAMWETWVRSLDWEDPLEKGEATHSSILAWGIPWTI